MSYLIKPANYKALLDMKQTELGIKQIKEFFQHSLSKIWETNKLKLCIRLPNGKE